MMTLKRRREIVKQFKAGSSIATIVRTMNPSRNPWTGVVELDVGDVIRSFVNGKFSLEPRKTVDSEAYKAIRKGKKYR